MKKYLNWYWLCLGPYKDSLAFNCKEAFRSEIKAQAIVTFRNLTEKGANGVWFVRKDVDHPDPDYKQFECPDCHYVMSERELDRTWDWAGPHCSQCGCTGLTMFAAVQERKPVMSGRK